MSAGADVAGAPAVDPGPADGAQGKGYTVHLRRRGGTTRGRIEVRANSVQHAQRVAVRQCIDVSYPKTKPAQWLVTSVEGPKP